MTPHEVIRSRGKVELSETLRRMVQTRTSSLLHQLRYPPHQKHAGLDLDLLTRRKQTYERARARNPLRWIREKTRKCNPVLVTSLNPDDPRQTERILKKNSMTLCDNYLDTYRMQRLHSSRKCAKEERIEAYLPQRARRSRRGEKGAFRSAVICEICG